MRSAARVGLAASLALGAACGDAIAGVPPRATHPMVGTYALRATFPTFVPDVRRSSVTEPSEATLTGTLVVGDTVVASDPRHIGFPDVRLTEVLCTAPGRCDPPESFASFTTLFVVENSVTFGFSTIGGARTLHFDGPFVGDSVAGTAWVQLGTSRYDGTFVARKQR